MTGRKTILQAPSGEDTSLDGTEAFPITGNKYALVSSILEYIRTAVATLTNKTINLTSNTLTGTTAQFNTALSDANFATTAGVETITNKTIGLTSNTLTGTTAQFNTALSDGDFTTLAGSETLTNKTLTSPTLTTPTFSGAAVFPDNVTQTFNPGADNAGLNVGSIAGDPATPDNGDMWYDSTANELTARIDGSNVALGSGGGGSVATDTIWDAKGDIAGGTGANTAARLAVGTDGQVLTADSGETTGLIWATPGAGTDVATDLIWDAKGDLAGGTGSNTAARLAVGANGTYLIADSAEATGMRWTAGGRVLISSSTPTGTGTVSFTSIPTSYTKLVIEYIARGTESAGSVSMDITLNNDTTDANYRREAVTAYATVGASPGAATGDDNVVNDAVIAATGPSGAASVGHIEIAFYAGTTFNKQIFSRHGHRRDTSSVHEQIDLRWIDWESTSAVNRVDLILAAGNFDTGTTIRLYGEY